MVHSSSYHCLCTLTLYHEYYRGPLDMGAVSLAIPAVTERLLHNAGVIVRKGERAVQLLHQYDGCWPKEDCDIAVRFGIRFDNPQFFSVTREGLNQIGSLLWFSTETPALAVDEEGMRYLHTGTAAGDADVKALGELDPDVAIPGVPVMVEINLKQLLAPQPEPGTKPVNYAVRFPARQLPWLYWMWFSDGKLKNLVGSHDQLSALRLQLHEEDSDDLQLQFEQIEEPVAINNQIAVRFLSSSPLKLGACSDFKLSLVYQSGIGDKTLIERLPHPAKDCLELLQVGDQRQIVASSHVAV